MSNFMKIPPVGTELFLRTDRHDEANSHFRNFENALKNVLKIIWRQRCLSTRHEDMWGSGGVEPTYF
jgi:hypothetical protein